MDENDSLPTTAFVSLGYEIDAVSLLRERLDAGQALLISRVAGAGLRVDCIATPVLSDARPTWDAVLVASAVLACEYAGRDPRQDEAATA